jgi:inorganic pyrophosphatase
MDFTKLVARAQGGTFHVVVESPRGATVKLAWDEHLAAFTLSRPLVLGVQYPFDWGFVPGTKAPDGDPLDALVMHDTGTYPGVVMRCAALGVLQLSQRKKGERKSERNDRVIAVPAEAPRYQGMRDVRDLPKRVRDELETFFVTVVGLENKKLDIHGWGGPAAAKTLLDRAVRAAR